MNTHNVVFDFLYVRSSCEMTAHIALRFGAMTSEIGFFPSSIRDTFRKLA